VVQPGHCDSRRKATFSGGIAGRILECHKGVRQQYADPRTRFGRLAWHQSANWRANCSEFFAGNGLRLGLSQESGKLLAK
jgi:hypothetical protein